MPRAFGWILAAVVASAAVPSPSDACGNAVLATDKVVAAVKEAEQILDDGDPADARARVDAILGQAEGFGDGTPVSRGLTRRVQRIRALASVRLDPDGHSGEHRKALLALAVGSLRWLLGDTPNDAAKLSDLGEALAKTSPADARKVLEDLARRDVVATPYAYAALAGLRAAAGDTAGRDEALARCRTMAKAAAICGVPAAKGAKP
jgi:hypothetical protein